MIKETLNCLVVWLNSSRINVSIIEPNTKVKTITIEVIVEKYVFLKNNDEEIHGANSSHRNKEDFAGGMHIDIADIENINTK